MNTTFDRTRVDDAFSLVETLVAASVAGALGLILVHVMQSSLTLAAKNVAVNAAHQEAREGVARMTRDIHAAVSVPQLRDTDFAWVSSTPVPGVSPAPSPPAAAGVSFQMIASGPNYVFQDPGNTTLIMIKDNPVPPLPGMRLIVPFWGQEDDILKVTSSSTSNHSNVFTVQAIETNIKKSPTYGGSTYAITYYTNRVMYLVRNGSYIPDPQGPYTITRGTYTSGNMDRYALAADGSYMSSASGSFTITPADYSSGSAQRYRYENGELHYYQWRSTSSNPAIAGTLYWKDVATVARYVSSPRPFSVALNSAGSSDNRFVNVRLSARDPRSTNRGYIATASLLDTQIDYRSRLTLYQ